MKGKKTLFRKWVSVATSLTMVFTSVGILSSAFLVKADTLMGNYDFEDGNIPSSFTGITDADDTYAVVSDPNGRAGKVLKFNSGATAKVNSEGFYNTVALTPNTDYIWTFYINNTNGGQQYFGVVAGSSVSTTGNTTIPFSTTVKEGAIGLSDNSFGWGIIGKAENQETIDTSWRQFGADANGWKKIEVRFSSGTYTSACLTYAVRGAGRGSYFDDWSIKSVEHIEPGTVVNGNFENGTTGFVNADTTVFETVVDPVTANGNVLRLVGCATRGKGTVAQDIIVEPNTDYIWTFRHLEKNLSYNSDNTVVYVTNGTKNLISDVYTTSSDNGSCPNPYNGTYYIGNRSENTWGTYVVHFNSGSYSSVTLKLNVWANSSQREMYTDDWTVEKRDFSATLNNGFEETYMGTDKPTGIISLTNADDTAIAVADPAGKRDGKVLKFSSGASSGINRRGLYQTVAVTPNTKYVWSFWMNNTGNINHYVGIVSGKGLKLDEKVAQNVTLPISDINVVNGQLTTFTDNIYTLGALTNTSGDADSNWKQFGSDANGWKKVNISFDSGNNSIISLAYIARAGGRTCYFDDWSLLPEESVANGGFNNSENGMLGYETDGGLEAQIVEDTEQVSLKITGGTTAFTPMLWQQVAVEPYTEYEWNFWYKSDTRNNVMSCVRAGEDSSIAVASIIDSDESGVVNDGLKLFSNERCINPAAPSLWHQGMTNTQWAQYTVRFYSGSHNSVLLTLNPVNSSRVGYTGDWELTRRSIRTGDVNADNSINSLDLSEYRRYLLSTNNTFSFSGSDVNKDGAFDIKDLVRMKRLITMDPAAALTDDYDLVWNDDFTGTALNTEKWNLDEHMHGQTDLEIRNDSSTVFVDNGSATLRSGINESTGGYYTNASLTTDKEMLFKYGYVEMRAKLPAGRPAFPSFWMKSSDYKSGNPSLMGEIDIFENFGTDTNLQMGCHCWENQVSTNTGKSYQVFADASEAEQWHTYGLWWTADFLRYYVDGVMIREIDISGEFINEENESQVKTACFNDYYYLIMNNYLYTPNGMGQGTDLAANADDTFPIDYQIDYVRLYQKLGEGSLVTVK